MPFRVRQMSSAAAQSVCVCIHLVASHASTIQKFSIAPPPPPLYSACAHVLALSGIVVCGSQNYVFGGLSPAVVAV
jgi:hypothetical protein